MPVHSNVCVGQLTFGGLVSTTVTLDPQRLVLLEPSVVAQLTGLGPSGRLVPGAGEQSAVSVPEHVSEAVAVMRPAVACRPAVHSSVCGAGQMIDGDTVSTTFTSNTQSASLFESSNALHRSSVKPNGKLFDLLISIDAVVL